MSYQTALEEIQQWIVANGNQEITADVLRPVLEEMLQACKDTTGELSDLSTADQSNLVAAINEIKSTLDSLNTTTAGVQIYYGTDDPTITPPTTFKSADFYLERTVDNDPIQLWQYNGFEWVKVVFGGSGGSGSSPMRVEYTGSPITVPSGYVVDRLFNASSVKSVVSGSVSGTELTITDGAFEGDILLIN